MCKTGSENRAGQKRADVTHAQQEGISELFNKTQNLESKILLTASQTPRMGRERPRHMISNPDKTLAFRESIPSMHQGIFALKINCMKFLLNLEEKKMHVDLQ